MNVKLIKEILELADKKKEEVDKMAEDYKNLIDKWVVLRLREIKYDG